MFGFGQGPTGGGKRWGGLWSDLGGAVPVILRNISVWFRGFATAFNWRQSGGVLGLI
jgi:hypothetical protein